MIRAQTDQAASYRLPDPSAILSSAMISTDLATPVDRMEARSDKRAHLRCAHLSVKLNLVHPLAASNSQVPEVHV